MAETLNIPGMGEAISDETVTGHEHYQKFTRDRKQRMQVARLIEKRPHEQNGHDASETMQGMEHLPDQLPFFVRVRERLKKAGLLVVKQEGKYTISQPLALVLIGILGTAFFAYYWRTSDKVDQQHDEIIKLQTRLDLEKEKNVDQDSKIDQARATAQIADKNAARLEGKFDQFTLQFATGKKKPPVDLDGEN